MHTISYNIYALFISILLSPMLLNAQNVRLSLDKDTIEIGEQIHLTFSVTNINNKDVQIEKWFPVSDSLVIFETIYKGGIDKSFIKDSYSYRQVLTITTFGSGEQIIPAFPILFKNKKYKTVFTISTAPIIVNVKTTDVSDLNDYHDVKSIISVSSLNVNKKLNFKLVLFIIIVFTVIVFLIIKLRYRHIVKRKHINSFQYALNQLSELEKKQLKEPDSIKSLHQKLYRILNECFSNEFNGHVQYFTSEQWIKYCNSLKFSAKLKDEFRLLIKEIDNIRFGRDELIKVNKDLISPSKDIVRELSKLKGINFSNHA